MADINIRIGAKLDELTAGLSKAEKQLKRSAYKMKKVGAEMSQSLTLPLAGFAGFALKAAGDFEESMNGVVANTKGAEASFDDLRDKAKELGRTTSKSATESANAIEMLGRNGLNATQILDGAADATVRLSEATKGNLSLAADIATDAMSQFGISAAQMDGTVDLIAGTLSNSKLDIEGFGLALGQAGGVAGAVGVNFADFTTSIAAIAPTFASGSDAGTGFKTFLTRLVPESQAATDKMKELGIITKEGANQFYDAQGNMKSMSDIAGVLQTAFAGLSEEQANSAAKTIFGTDAMRAGIALSKVGAKNFDELAQSIGAVSAEEMAAKRMEGFNGAMKRMASAFEALQIAMADSGLLDMMTNFVTRVTGVLVSLSNTNPAVFRFAVAIGAVFAAIGPVMFAIGAFKSSMAGVLGVAGMVTKGLSSLNTVFGVLKSVMWLATASHIPLTGATLTLNAALLANPVGMVVAAFAGFVAILAVVSTRSEKARQMLNGIFSVLKSIGQFILEVGKMILNTIVGIIKVLGSMLMVVVDVFQGIGSAIMSLLQRIPIIGKIAKFLADSFKMAGQAITKIFNNLPALFEGIVAEARNTGVKIKAFFDKLALSARILGQKIQKGITIDGDARAELQKSIDKLESQKKALAKKGEAFGVAFNKAFSNALNKGVTDKVTEATNVSTNIPTLPTANVPQQAQPIQTSAINYNVDTKGGGISEEATESVKNHTNAIIDLKDAQALQTIGMTESIEPLEMMGAKLDEITTKTDNFKTKSQEMAEQLATFNEGLTNIINQGLNDVAVGIGEMAGAMAAGSMSMADAGAQLVSMLAGILGEIGKLAIKTGIATLGIKAALESLNPALAIAGGVALVALSKFVKAKMSSVTALADGGILTKPVFSQGFLAGEAGPEAVIPLNKLSDYVGGGGSQNVNVGGEFTISGTSLKLLLDKVNRHDSRTR